MSDGPAAGWYADPLERFDHRYWDGQTWTEHVSTAGSPTTDPLVAPAPSQDRTESDFAEVGSRPEPDPEPAWPSATRGATPAWRAPTTTRTTNAKAIVSLVLSLLWIGGLASIAAIIVGALARRDIRASGGREGGEGVALAGIVIGALGLLATILLGVALAAFVGAAETGRGSFATSFEEGTARLDGFGAANGELESALVGIEFQPCVAATLGAC